MYNFKHDIVCVAQTLICLLNKQIFSFIKEYINKVWLAWNKENSFLILHLDMSAFFAKGVLFFHSLTSLCTPIFSPSSTSSIQGHFIFDMHYKFLSFSSYVSSYFSISLSFSIYLILGLSIIDFSKFFWRFYFDLCLMLV